MWVSLLTKYWQVIIGFAGAAFLAWTIHNLIIDDIKNKAEIHEKEAISQAVAAQLKLDNESNQPAIEANNNDKTNSDNLLNECFSELRTYQQRASACLHPGTTTSGTYTTDTELSKLNDNPIARLWCKRENNDLNTAKIWGQNCIKVGRCK